MPAMQSFTKNPGSLLSTLPIDESYMQMLDLIEAALAEAGILQADTALPESDTSFLDERLRDLIDAVPLE